MTKQITSVIERVQIGQGLQFHFYYNYAETMLHTTYVLQKMQT